MSGWTLVVICQESEMFTFNHFSGMYVGEIVCQTRKHTQFISRAHNNQLFFVDVSDPTPWF